MSDRLPEIIAQHNRGNYAHRIDCRVCWLISEVERLTKLSQEVCICAAVRASDGYIARGHRHGECFTRMLAHRKPSAGCVQGFMTSRNRFVDRAEGRALQDAAGLTSADPLGYETATLLSEDLY